MQAVSASPIVSAAQVSELIGAVYDGVLEQPPWGSLLAMLRVPLRASWTALIVRPPIKGALAQIVNAGPEGIGVAEEKFRSQASFDLDVMSQLPPMQMVTVDELMGAESWLRSEAYRFLDNADCRYTMAANVLPGDTSGGRLCICRGAAAGDFTAGEKALCQFLLPHLRRAFEMHLRLTANESDSWLYTSTVDRMLVGAVVLDMQGQILRVNEVAHTILNQRDGLDLVFGRLRAHYMEDDRRLQAALRQALADARAGREPAEQTLNITRPTGSAKLSVMLRHCPISEWSFIQRQSAVLLTLRDPGIRSQVSAESLGRAFGLTPAEAQLCIQLIEGMTLDEAAERLSIRKNTARAHLRAIFGKTQVTRQSALVSLLMAGTRGL
jgi:DNA-binding CsgD family transcriptional regulator